MFTHSPLSQADREIRLLRFTDTTTDNHETISLELQHVSLNDDISYAALSYTWGTTDCSVEVRLNGRRFRITQNLYEALQQLRQNGIKSWLWIDAICIRQSNHVEKAWQIMQMPETFGRAKVVYMWLGAASVETNLTMDFISRVGPKARACDAGAFSLDLKKEELITSYIKRQSSFPEADGADSKLGRFFYDLLSEAALQTQSPLTTGIRDILQRDYWHRIWIIQEVVLAKDPIVVIGEKCVPLDVFDAALTAIRRCKRWNFNLMHPAWNNFCPGFSDHLYRIISLDIRRLRHYLDWFPVRLVDVLFENTTERGRPRYIATDPRDILFGLLGVLDKEQIRGIRVDYNKSVVDVFTDLTRALIVSGEEGGSPFHLGFCDPGEPAGYLPTWVPDWREIGMHGVRTSPIYRRRAFNTSLRFSQQISASSAEGDGKVLHRFGCRVDTITAVMHPPEWVQATPSGEYQVKDTDSWFQSIVTFTGLDSESGPGEDYIWRTIMRDGIEGVPVGIWYGPNIEEARAICRKMMRAQHVDAKSLTDEQVKSIYRSRLLSGLDPNCQTLNDQQVALFASLWRKALGSWNRNRTLFKTSKGMLGLGHIGIQAGELVTLIWGTGSPVTLRPRLDGGFYFRGDAYVDGIMGEGEYYCGNHLVEEEFYIY